MATKVDPVAQGMSESDKTVLQQGKPAPRMGDRYRCDQCGMELEVTADCGCDSSHVHLECCGQELSQQSRPTDAARDAGRPSAKPNDWQG